MLPDISGKEPFQEFEADVVIVGGGPSGIAAAIAASRNGSTAILVERHGFLGGMATAALVGPFMTSYDATGHRQIVRGIFEEVVELLTQRQAALHPSQVGGGSKYSAFISFGHHHVTPIDPEAFKLVALDLCEQASVRLLFNSWAVAVEKDGNIIRSVVFVHPKGVAAVSGRVFIDATGDGDIAAFSGVPYIMGRALDSLMQPASVFIRVYHVFEPFVAGWVVDHRATVHPHIERMFKCLIDKAKSFGEFPLSREHVGTFRGFREDLWGLNVTRVLGADATTSLGLTKAELEGRRQVDHVVRFLRKYCPGFEQVCLLDTGVQCGVRETRHIEGLYTMTYEDVTQARKFPDAIACFAYPIDIHQVDGRNSLMDGVQGEYYQIPYRALLPKVVDNLIVVGRCISASHEAAGSLRVMPGCFATGQAGGVATALAVRRGLSVKEVDIRELQSLLVEQGVYLGGDGVEAVNPRLHGFL